MTKRLVYGFLCFFLVIALGLSSCAPPSKDSESPEETPTVQVEPPADSSAVGPTPTLSSQVQDAVLAAIAADQSLPPDQLTLQNARADSWPDSCLGLANPDELCAQMITPGWEIIVTDGQTTWTYRTNDLGDQIRLATQ
ncbi:MAG: hypothetical protein AAGF01_10550 [Cyanobacteria bacterium P01_G01_bin.38]